MTDTEGGTAVDPNSEIDAEAVPVEADEAVTGELRHLSSAVAAAIFGVLLAAAANQSAPALLIAAAIVQGVLILSWVLTANVPGKWGVMLLAGAASAGADVAASVSPHGQLGALLPVLGFAVPLMFALQLTRGVARSRVVEALANISVLIAAVVAIVALLQLRHESTGEQITVAVIGSIALAIVVGHLCDLVAPLGPFDPEVPRGLLAVVGSALAGAALSYLMLRNNFEFQSLRAAFLGFGLGLVAALLAVGAGFIQHSAPAVSASVARLRPVYGVLLPICFTAPIGFLLCLAIRS